MVAALEVIDSRLLDAETDRRQGLPAPCVAGSAVHRLVRVGMQAPVLRLRPASYPFIAEGLLNTASRLPQCLPWQA